MSVFGFYLVDAMICYSHSRETLAEQYVLTDPGDVRETVNRWLARHGRELLTDFEGADPDDEPELRVTAWQVGRRPSGQIDLRPFVRRTDAQNRNFAVHIDWPTVTLPPLGGQPLPLGHPVRVAGAVYRFGHAYSALV